MSISKTARDLSVTQAVGDEALVSACFRGRNVMLCGGDEIESGPAALFASFAYSKPRKSSSDVLCVFRRPRMQEQKYKKYRHRLGMSCKLLRATEVK